MSMWDGQSVYMNQNAIGLTCDNVGGETVDT